MPWNAQEYRAFAKALRRADPELAKGMRRELRTIGKATVDELRAAMPHKENASKALTGIRYSDSLASMGGAIVVGGMGTPRSWAYAFAAGNRGPGQLKHKVYGHWSSSPNTIMPTGTWYEDVMVKVVPSMIVRAESVIEGVLAEIAGMSHV